MDNIKPIPPFKRFCGMLGAFPEAFSDAMTVYEALEWLYRFLNNTVIPAIQNESKQVEELTLIVKEMKEYIDHYFDNLDVQEEINNKLDAMVESGQLQEIMASYLSSNVAWVFDTIDDMKEATNLIDGSYAKTIGYKTKTDNGGCLYYIRTRQVSDKPNDSTTIAIGDSLVAKLVYTEDFLPVTYTYVRYQGTADRRTDVWYSIIPADFKPEVFVANDTIGTVQEPSENACNNMTTITINGSCGTGDNYEYPVGVVIKDGEVLKDNSGNNSNHDVLYMDENGELHTLPWSSTTAAILEENPEWALCGFKAILEDGTDYSGDHDPTDYKPRTFIGQNESGDYFVGVCAGRQYDNPGLSYADMKNFVESIGFEPTFLYNLDGGGSACLVDRCKRINKLDNYENRPCSTYIGFRSKFAKNKSAFEAACASNKADIMRIQDLQPSEQVGFINVADSVSSVFTLDSATKFTKVGDLIVMNLNFTTTDSIDRYVTVLENIPPSQKPYVHFQVFDNAGHNYAMYLTNNRNLAVGSGVALPAGTYNANVVYQLKYNA